MRTPTWRAGALALILCACAPDDGHVPVSRVPLHVAAASRALLHAESEHPLALGTAVAVGQDTLVVADRATGDLWLMDASRPELGMQRVLAGQDRGRARVVAVSAGPDGWDLLDRSGAVHRFHRDWQHRGTTRLDHGGGAIAAAMGDGRGGFLLVVRRRYREGGGVQDVLLRTDAQGGTRELWQAPRGAGGAAGDMLSLAAAPDGWTLAGSDPARVIRFDTLGTWLGQEPVRPTPRRQVGPEVREQFQRLAAAGGMAGSVRPPEHYPPLTALMQVGRAWLAVPYTGGPTGEAQGLDVYCDLRYSRTLLDAPDITQVLLAGPAVMVLREVSPFSYELSIFRTAELPLECGPA
jgi:hypothetical protein